MTKPATPSAPKPAGDDRNLVAVDKDYVAPSFEDRLALIWKNNRRAVLIVLGAVVAAIVVRGAWEYYAAEKEAGIRQDFADASTPEKLKAFVAAHPDHPLSGVAQLQQADDAYAAGKSGEAAAAYGQAAASLKIGPLASRAQLGQAMAQIQAGKFAEGEAALRGLAADAKQAKETRAEAAYVLASRALSEGHYDDVRKFADQIEANSPWAQRAMLLRASLPVTAATADGAPAIAAPAPKK